MRRIPLSLILVAMLGCERAPEATPTTSSTSATTPPTPTTAPATGTNAGGAAPADPTGIDPCVLGEWRMPAEMAQTYYRAMLSQQSAPVDVLAVTGESRISMNAAGNATHTISALTVSYRIPGGSTPVEMQLTLNGAGTARFTAQGGTMAYTDSTSRFDGNVKVRVAGTEREVPLDARMTEAFGRTSQGTAQYRCEPGRLTITHAAMPGAPVTWVR